MVRGEHPRPDFMRDNWLNLNGEWDFGFEEGKVDPAAPALPGKITVPFSWASPASKVGEDRKGAAWYARRVRFSAPGEIFLVIGAADYDCRVYVNGQMAGSHRGGYGEIRLNVTPYWRGQAENLLCIRVEDNDGEAQTRGKQGYGEIRGIWQTVYLEAAPATRLERLRIRTNLDGNISFLATVYAATAGTQPLALDFGPGARLETQLKLTAGRQELKWSLPVAQPHLWSCEDPYLYEGSVRVGEDRVHTYFGVREVGSRVFAGKDCAWITLNGEPVYLNGTLDQSFNPKGYFTLPSEAEIEAEARRLKALGLNLARIHIKPEEPRKLYWLDKLGILVFADMVCFWGEPTAATQAQFEQELFEMLERDANHPCVIAWILFNETWGLFTATGPHMRQYAPSTQAWVRELYHRVKAWDPTRLVEDNSACNLDHVETDVNTWHFYLNGYMTVKEAVDTAARGAHPGSGWNYIAGNAQKGYVPLMNSECGMVWGVQDSAGDSDLAWQYHYMLNEFRLQEKVCGFVFTELHDVVNEFNGYYRIDGAKKDFGYQDFVPGMEISDLHAKDFIAVDCPPCRTVGPGEKVSVPLAHSSFGGVPAASPLELRYTLWHQGPGGRCVDDQGELSFTAAGPGVQPLGGLPLTLPKEAALCVLALELCAQGRVLSRNFTCFDVRGGRWGKAWVRPADETGSTFAHAWSALQGEKRCGAGAGAFTYALPLDQLPQDCRAVDILLEASAKQLLAKDGGGGKAVESGADFMQGYRMDPGTNHNSYLMTDEKQYPSCLHAYADGELVHTQCLPDDPADSRGVLSWHYQMRERYLDEAGSYGYLVRIRLEGEALRKAKARGSCLLRLEAGGDQPGGLAVYGRNAGRYPIDIELLPIV